MSVRSTASPSRSSAPVTSTRVSPPPDASEPIAPPSMTASPATPTSASAMAPVPARAVSGPVISARDSDSVASATVMVVASVEICSISAAPVEVIVVVDAARPDIVTPPVSTLMTRADTSLSAPVAPAVTVASASSASSRLSVVAAERPVAPATERSFAVRSARRLAALSAPPMARRSRSTGPATSTVAAPPVSTSASVAPSEALVEALATARSFAIRASPTMIAFASVRLALSATTETAPVKSLPALVSVTSARIASSAMAAPPWSPVTKLAAPPTEMAAVWVMSSPTLLLSAFERADRSPAVIVTVAKDSAFASSITTSPVAAAMATSPAKSFWSPPSAAASRGSRTDPAALKAASPATDSCRVKPAGSTV